MKKFTLIVLALASMVMFACTKESGNGEDPIIPIEGESGSLVVGIPGVVKTLTTLASTPYTQGGQNAHEMRVENIYVYLFKEDVLGDGVWKLRYSVKTRDFTPTEQELIPSDKVVFPLFDYGEEQYGKIEPEDEVMALFVANYSLVGEGSESARLARWASDFEGKTMADIKKLTLLPPKNIESNSYLNSPFVMYGEAGEGKFKILSTQATTVTDVALVRVPARIDITNTMGAHFRILGAKLLDAAKTSYLAPDADRTNIGTEIGYINGESQYVANRGYDATLGLVPAVGESAWPGVSMDSMWSQLFAYPTYNVLPNEGLEYNDPANVAKRTPTKVVVHYTQFIPGTGQMTNFDTVEFHNYDINTPANDTIVAIQRNHRYEIKIAPAQTIYIPKFTIIAEPWTDSLAVDTADVHDLALSLTFDNATMSARQITFDNRYPDEWGGTLTLPATRTVATDSFNFSIGYESSYAALTIEKPDWVNIENYPGASPTLADNAVGGFKGRLDVHITNNPIMPRTGRIVIKNSDRKYTYIINQGGDAAYVAKRSANSFIVPFGGKIAFPASRANADGQARLAANDTIIARVLWADAANVLADGDVSVQGVGSTAMIGVKSGSAAGNAVVVAIKKATGAIVWSWHIWNTDYNPDLNIFQLPAGGTRGTRLQRAEHDGVFAVGNGLVFRYTGAGRSTQTTNADRSQMNAEGSLPNNEYGIYDATNVFMDRNLGAINAKPGDASSKGLLYQWGRKDPFPGSNAWTTDEPTYIRNGVGTILGNMSTGGTNGVTAPTDANFNANFIVKMPVNNADIAAWKGANGDATTNTNNYAIAHPHAFIYGINNDQTGYDWYTAVNDRAAQNDSLWGWTLASNMNYRKSVYDPCPDGWRVPKNGAWQGLDDDDSNTSFVEKEYAFMWRGAPWNGRFGVGGKPGFGVGAYDAWLITSGMFSQGDWNGGASTTDPTWAPGFSSAATVGYFPAAGFRSDATGATVGASTDGVCWSSSRSGPDDRLSYGLWFPPGGFVSSEDHTRATAFTVRCVQEEY